MKGLEQIRADEVALARSRRSKPRPVGRPPLGDNARTSVLTLKVSERERNAWEQRAEAARRTLSDWIRERCNRKAR
jgi:hypothetical protein